MNIEDWTKQVQEVAYQYDEEPMKEELLQGMKRMFTEYTFPKDSLFAAWCNRGNEVWISPANPEMERYFFFWASSFRKPRECQTSEGKTVLLIEFGFVEGIGFYLVLDGSEDVYGICDGSPSTAHRIGTFSEFLERMLQEVIAGRKLRDAYDQWEEAGDGSNFSPPDDSDYVSLNDYVRRLDNTYREAAKKAAPQG